MHRGKRKIENGIYTKKRWTVYQFSSETICTVTIVEMKHDVMRPIVDEHKMRLGQKSDLQKSHFCTGTKFLTRFGRVDVCVNSYRRNPELEHQRKHKRIPYWFYNQQTRVLCSSLH
jgi:hypothetical protein